MYVLHYYYYNLRQGKDSTWNILAEALRVVGKGVREGVAVGVTSWE